MRQETVRQVEVVEEVARRLRQRPDGECRVGSPDDLRCSLNFDCWTYWHIDAVYSGRAADCYRWPTSDRSELKVWQVGDSPCCEVEPATARAIRKEA